MNVHVCMCVFVHDDIIMVVFNAMHSKLIVKLMTTTVTIN